MYKKLSYSQTTVFPFYINRISSKKKFELEAAVAMWKARTKVIFLAAAVLGNCFLMTRMEVQTIYLKGLLCKPSEKFIYPNLTSRAKSYNRTFSSFTILGTAKKPINDLFVNSIFSLYKRS